MERERKERETEADLMDPQWMCPTDLGWIRMGLEFDWIVEKEDLNKEIETTYGDGGGDQRR